MSGNRGPGACSRSLVFCGFCCQPFVPVWFLPLVRGLFASSRFRVTVGVRSAIAQLKPMPSPIPSHNEQYAPLTIPKVPKSAPHPPHHTTPHQ